MSDTKLSEKGIYVMSKDEMRSEIFRLRRELQLQIDLKYDEIEKLESAKSQGFFDGFRYSTLNNSWVRK